MNQGDLCKQHYRETIPVPQPKPVDGPDWAESRSKTLVYDWVRALAYPEEPRPHTVKPLIEAIAQSFRDQQEKHEQALRQAREGGEGRGEKVKSCTPTEREFLNWLYVEHEELNAECDLIADFPGYYADWEEIIDTCPEDIRMEGYSQSPTELIYRLTNQRDEARAAPAASPPSPIPQTRPQGEFDNKAFKQCIGACTWDGGCPSRLLRFAQRAADTIDSLRAELAALKQPAPSTETKWEWIAVSDRLPPMCVNVVVIGVREDINILPQVYQARRWSMQLSDPDAPFVWCVPTDQPVERVTHWMPLPSALTSSAHTQGKDKP